MGVLGKSITEMIAETACDAKSISAEMLNTDPAASISIKIKSVLKDAHPTACVDALDTIPGVVENQIVKVMVPGTNQCEECFVDKVTYNFDHYIYSLIGLRSYRTYFTTHIVHYSSVHYNPIMLTEIEAAEVRLVAIEVDYFKNYSIAKKATHLTTTTIVESYSEKCLVIFTTNKSDIALLQTIRAKRNDSLTWEGRKQSGWIIPKCRQEDLNKIMAPRCA